MISFVWNDKYLPMLGLGQVPHSLRLSSGIKNDESRHYAIILGGFFDPKDGAKVRRDICRGLSHITGAARSGCL